jgi:hypothetical protein
MERQFPRADKGPNNQNDPLRFWNQTNADIWPIFLKLTGCVMNFGYYKKDVTFYFIIA